MKTRASRAQLGDILYTCAESIRIITALVAPVLPDAAAKVWQQLGLGDIAQADLKNIAWGELRPGTKLGEASTALPPRRKGCSHPHERDRRESPAERA